MSRNLSDPGDGEELAGVAYPAHQTFKTRARDQYCSSQTVRSHAEGSAWVAACMAHFGIQANNLLGAPTLMEDCPNGAIVWP